MSVKAYEQLLNSLATSDERIVVMTAENRAAIRTLPTHIGSRFIDVGICEQTLLGVAAGLAARGRRPIVHALAAFLTMRGFEFIRTDIGIGNLPVILVGGVPGLLSDGNGPTHQAIEDIAHDARHTWNGRGCPLGRRRIAGRNLRCGAIPRPLLCPLLRRPADIRTQWRLSIRQGGNSR